ncbi:hypothetical protein [Paenibacillus sp. IHBB 10380]|uniref:hypothetical protein n=1 Tax=Paenibacillus sp. IHBB 10380 TaxID=1566358 RepID=UPI001F3B8A0C|nr:hypothetical protein [Paenibacillus sp. IHBB 10380]
MMRKSALFMTIMVIVLLTSITTTSAIGYQPVEPKDDTSTAMITSIVQENGHLYIEADHIQWYEGEAANEKFLEREQDTGDMTGPPDGYYVINDDPQLQKLEVAADAEVLMQIYDHDGTYESIQVEWNEPVSLHKFEAIYHNNELLDASVFPYHLTVNDGKVVKIVQQFIP